ncbi:hypothetical protein AOQ72_10545 [Bradyrhizobium yuanmingense]|uniref:Uncharacterized protein n=1 Tax=Bradyrhizobium yuanmingense TaxID=108015 RepID=A0A0R3CWC4_9BRAD|nr:hypothetical protein [Bradyrhizobium yuanmingense]KRQ01846.1 hypothetical protein AOQ72_10545 [Bradyrhizobium yuanmingense]
MTFEPATNTGPHTITSFTTPNDPTVVLPDAAAARFVQLKQRCHDLHAAVPGFADLQQQSHAVIGHKKRIDDLTRPRAEGGFGLPELAPQVVAERRELERAEKEFDRLKSLKEIRGARWQSQKRLEAKACDWVLRGGIPSNCEIVAVEDRPVSELLTKADGGRIDAAISRLQMRLRELGADAHRARSSPWPSSVAKKRAKAALDQMAAAPNLDDMIEHNAPLTLPSRSLRAMVHGTEQPALAVSETVDALGFLVWIFRHEMLAKIDAGLDEIADDTAALDEKTRAELEATIAVDSLDVHRRICTLIWHAEKTDGEIIDFAADTPPEALLGVELRTLPRASPLRGTSPQHAINIIGARR